VFKVVLLSNCWAVFLGHNHPSGDVNPSKDDLEITERIVKAGKILNILVLDHVIVGSEGFYSLKVEHPEIFEGG
jgi:DNA repair protein RadC